MSRTVLACALAVLGMPSLPVAQVDEPPQVQLDGIVTIEASPCGAQPAGRPPCMNVARAGAFVKLAVIKVDVPRRALSVTTDHRGGFHLALQPGLYRIGLHPDMINLVMLEHEIELQSGADCRVELKIKALSP